jgi:hypothetical protein
MNDFLTQISGLIFIFFYVICFCVVPILAPFIVLISTQVFADRSHQFSKNENDVFWTFVLGFINPIRQKFNKPKIWIIPQYRRGEQEISRASKLYLEATHALEHAPISQEKKFAFQKQAFFVPYNISKAIWRQSRLSDLYKSIQHNSKQATKSQNEINTMIDNLDTEISRSLDTLTTVSVSLMSVELALGDLEIDRLFNELGKSNNRLRELSDTYKNAKYSQTG